MNYLPNPLTAADAARLRQAVAIANSLIDPVARATLLMHIVIDCARLGVSLRSIGA